MEIAFSSLGVSAIHGDSMVKNMLPSANALPKKEHLSGQMFHTWRTKSSTMGIAAVFSR
jgi:hypothetical protein